MVFPSDDPRVLGVRWPLVLIMPIVFYMFASILDWIVNLGGSAVDKMEQSSQQAKQALRKSARKKRMDQTKKQDDV